MNWGSHEVLDVAERRTMRLVSLELQAAEDRLIDKLVLQVDKASVNTWKHQYFRTDPVTAAAAG